jgi:hypothetical protein
MPGLLPKVEKLPDVGLKFRKGHEIIYDPKYGLKTYYPFNWNSGSRSFDEIKIGIVCIEGYEQRIIGDVLKEGMESTEIIDEARYYM